MEGFGKGVRGVIGDVCLWRDLLDKDLETKKVCYQGGNRFILTSKDVVC